MVRPFCSYLDQLELRMFKTYSKRQNFVQNKKPKTDVQNLENILRIPFGYLGVLHLDLFQTFLKIFGLYPSFFLIICNKRNVKKSQMPPFTFFGTVRLFKIIMFDFFRKHFNVSEWPLSIFFDILQQEGC